MKAIILLLSAALLCPAAYSQSKKAEEILDEVSMTTKSYNTIKIDFTYEMVNEKADIHEKETGVLKVKGEKYRLSIAGQVVINDGETMWTYIEDANEVQIHDVEEEDEGIITPTKLLTDYAEDFKPKFVGEQLWMRTKVSIIELQPKEEKAYERVELKIDPEKDQIMQISIFDKSDNVFIYTLEEYKVNVLFGPDDFTFKKEDHPGVEVIDMRL